MSSLTRLNRTLVSRPKLPIKILQFGEGNFLRAFANWIIQQMNMQLDYQAGVAVVQPIPQGTVSLLKEQEGLYTLYLRGYEQGEAKSQYEVIDCIQESINPYQEKEAFLAQAQNPDLTLILSNTTEAGITYDTADTFQHFLEGSFPAKLTRFLFERYQYFERAEGAGCIFLPCELINFNGDKLKECLVKYAALWNLEPGFLDWLEGANTFCNTLVDRIVPGYPKDRMKEVREELGYEDQLVSEGEWFHLWVIEGPPIVREVFPADKIGLNVLFTDDMQPYRTRKVRILNGAHTSTVPVGYLYGLESVRESVEHDVVGSFIQQTLFSEIIPTLDLPSEELKAFAQDVLDRFRNPFVHHRLISISLNSISKFKTRCLPSLLTYVEQEGQLPKNLSFSLASLLYFYRGEKEGQPIPLKDTPAVLEYFTQEWTAVENGNQDLETFVEKVLSQEAFWGQSLSSIPELAATIKDHLIQLQAKGMKNYLPEIL
ncbi:MAG: tagaturonate reductase [Bacteroidota bacterium]